MCARRAARQRWILWTMRAWRAARPGRASRFGELERFVADFLTGGPAAGESLRLKLQTPLFVADALLDAAGQQLAAERATAQQVT